MLVHLVQVAYTSGFIEQKKRIHMHALSHEEKCMGWKININEY